MFLFATQINFRTFAENIAMKTLEEIFTDGRDAGSIVDDLKVKSVVVPDWAKLIRDYEPSFHKIRFDKTGRRDKTRSDGTVEEAARISIGLEKLLVRRMTEFMFAIPVKRVYHNTEGSDVRQSIASAIESIYKYARINAENTRRGIAYFASCEIFTMWYLIEKPNRLYGFDSKYKLKCRTYSPMDGVSLYPLIDERGDMLCMSFEYKQKVLDSDVCFFDSYTSDGHYFFKNTGGGWERVYDDPDLAIQKIPGVYVWRPAPVFAGLSGIRNDIEYTVSRASDVIAYNAAPVLKVIGNMVGKEEKGETKRIFRMQQGGDVGYVSWSQSIEALKYHVDTMLRLFWSQSQMPDISFDNMAQLGNIGYDARQTLLTDAHLKVGDESGAWIEAFDRESSVVKEYLKVMNPAWKNDIDEVEIEHIITPFIQNDEKSNVDVFTTANGGKPVMSHLESIRRAGYSDNPEETLNQILNEEAAKSSMRTSSIFNEGVV